MNIFKDQRPLYGQDPFIHMYNGYHHLVESIDEKKIAVSIINPHTMRRVTQQIVWESSSELQVWAPELHQIDGHWFIYYSSSNGENNTHGAKVIGAANNPFGPYLWSQNLIDPWSIDMTTFVWEGKRYAAWSGWDRNKDEFPQNLYIAPMISPVEVGERVLLTKPEFDWELSIKPINEGPQTYIKDGRLFMLFSANASWTQEYATGLLELIGVNPLNSWHWVKRDRPLMLNAGHGMVVGDDFWYHRKMSVLEGWTDREIYNLPFENLIKSRL